MASDDRTLETLAMVSAARRAKGGGGKGQKSSRGGCMMMVLVLLLLTVGAGYIVQTRYSKSQLKVSGMVTDADGRPISGAEVFFQDQVTTTDAKGAFVLTFDRRTGTAEMRVTHSGYGGQARREVRLDGYGTRRFDIVLTRDGSAPPAPATYAPSGGGDDRSAGSGGGGGEPPPPAGSGSGGAMKVVRSANYQGAIDLNYDDMLNFLGEMRARDREVVDVEVYGQGGRVVYAAVAQPVGPTKVWFDTRSSFIAKDAEFLRDRLYLIDIEPYREGGVDKYAGVWAGGVTREASYRFDMDWATLIAYRRQMQKARFQLVDIEAREVDGGIRYAGLWHAADTPERLWKAGSVAELASKNREFEQEGDRLVDIEVMREDGATKYLAVWNRGKAERRYVVDADAATFQARQAEFDGYGLVLQDLEVVSGPGGERYAGVWGRLAAGNDAQRHRTPKLLE